jgi:hypothetical protein
VRLFLAALTSAALSLEQNEANSSRREAEGAEPRKRALKPRKSFFVRLALRLGAFEAWR